MIIPLSTFEVPYRLCFNSVSAWRSSSYPGEQRGTYQVRSS